ncbi:hypothetical protein D9619_012928 [Psilocybe cf. subviscida]|uniref:Glycoside hydrolase family 12 protein n=1 Tax=Psilocybe cf. subviscida TaxID=2480587 RepID=A0A8H5BIF7_9AGAR|nr:hypothetical protein D9619_012928 [Psilocybe cf. subviscida]
MLFFKSFVSLALAVTLVTASPTPETPATQDLAKRYVLLTGQYASESVANGRFVIGNNLWGMSSANSGGWQNTQATYVNGNNVQWYTIYNWAGGPYNVKSYANLDLKVRMGKSLSSISSIPVTWSYKYSAASSNLVSNVSFDLWLSNNRGSTGATSASTFEVMVWLSTRGGAQPIGSQIATVNINGVSWKVWKGPVQNWTCFSFVAPYEITSYNSDLKPFLNYLTSNQGVPSSQFLVQAQAGTEPFVGSATLTTTSYAMSVN